MEPEEFFDKWIPILYGIRPGEYTYRKACIEEISRWLGEEVVQRSSIEANWIFYGKNKKYPSYLPSFLNLLDKQYSILKTFNQLPHYQTDSNR